MDASNVWIALALHHAMHARDAYVVPPTRGDPALDARECARHIDGADPNAQDVDPFCDQDIGHRHSSLIVFRESVGGSVISI
jgi:hypothetical protein